MFDGHFRTSVDRAVKPLGDSLRRTKMTPDHLTIAGMLIACGAAVAIGAGYLSLGLLLVILAALPDLLDGALAKASNTSSQRGAFSIRSSTASLMLCCLVELRGISFLTNRLTWQYCLLRFRV